MLTCAAAAVSAATNMTDPTRIARARGSDLASPAKVDTSGEYLTAETLFGPIVRIVAHEESADNCGQ
jgi:hypothetical protein